MKDKIMYLHRDSAKLNYIWRKQKLIPLAATAFLGIGVLASFAVIGQSAPPNIQKLNIASVPLYAATQGDKPTLALALSVEFPTVGAQYVDQPNTNTDSSYSPDTEYIGYYNSEMCYGYQDKPTETPAPGKSKVDYKRFTIIGSAIGRRCADAFSGNFLNWASNSAIDMLRLALAGGDRVVDQENLTILQRAILPDNSLSASDNGPGCFWNSNNFPAKGLERDGGNYFGAIPRSMRTAAGNKKVWVGNVLNHIHFAAADGPSGNCASIPSSYNLGTTVYQDGMGSITNAVGGAFSSDGRTSCAAEGGTCSTNGSIKQVWYGEASRGWKTAPISGTFTCNNAKFGDPAVGVTKRCYLTDYSGSWKPAVRIEGINTDGFFYSRAEVCNTDASGDLMDVRDYSFCNKYPHGNYKPTGTIQKYHSQLRLAAFGYAIDNTLSYSNGKDGRYGGVLRAPMKYVGPLTYDIDGQENGRNPNAEWDEQTGIFKNNPDGNATFGNSGVINYLNKFGRLLPNKLGNYKRYDPASELYYETLRYMQGLPPSPAAVSGLTAAMHDGFPIYTDWTAIDPFANRPSSANYSCLKSNIALIGDVNTHDAKSYGKSRMPAVSLANNIPDIQGWLGVVQAFESKQSRSYTDGSGALRVTNNPNNASYSGTPAPTNHRQSADIIGLSYWAHTHDIRGVNWTAQPDKQRPGLRIKTFIFDVNEYATEFDINRRHTNNQYYMAAKYGGFRNQPEAKDNTLPYNIQGNPFYNQDGRADNDVWQDSDRKMEPQSYFLQSDARGVLTAIEKIFSDAASAMNNIAENAASGNNLAQTDLYLYRASFDTGSWTGDVQAFAIETNATTGRVQVASTPTWSAERELSKQLASKPDTSDRNIFVGVQRTRENPNPTGNTATMFTANSIEPALQDMLNRPSPSAAVDNLWQDRVNYLRGSNAKEGNPFRARSRAMGDIVNSGVQYIGSPSATRALGDGYNQYVAANSSRTAAVYVGANDGMMHAFNAKTGRELFAYIPSWMGPKLSALTDVSYKYYTHQAYVDATPVIGDAKIGRGSTENDWKTVLVSGTGGGGKGIFALDVTKPDNFTADSVMWEFTHVNDADMGYVIGKPRIVKMQVQSEGGSENKYKWFALVPAGANNYVDIGDGIYSTTGKAAIFLLALDKGKNESWQEGVNYYKISLPYNPALYQSSVSGAGQLVKATGIINLEAVVGSNQNAVDLVYAGDLHGNLWVLNFAADSAKNATNWKSEKLSRFVHSGNAIPMYTARDSAGEIQPITSAPAILKADSVGTYVVGFGTGKYIEISDATNTQVNTYYALYDDGTSAMTSGSSASSWPVGIAGRGRLMELIVDPSDANRIMPRSAFKWGRPSNDTSNVRAGWYYDFPKTGERIVSDGVYVPLTASIDFNSLIPGAASASGVCGAEGGASQLYSINYFSGTATVKESMIGMVGQPLYVLKSSGSSLTPADSTGQREDDIVYVDPRTGQEKRVRVTRGRLSWRQVNDYLELRSQQ